MYLIVIKNEGTIHKKMNGPKNIQCEKWFFIVVNRLLEYVLQKVLHFYLSTYKFFMITVPSTNIGTLDKYEQRQLWK